VVGGQVGDDHSPDPGRGHRFGRSLEPELDHRVEVGHQRDGRAGLATFESVRDELGRKLQRLGEPESTEGVAIQRFFEGINKYLPQIVSWNGRNFDLPVLVARGLINGVTAACFWDTGQDNKEFKWSNYINRFRDRHLDLMDVLAIYGGRGSPLDEVSRLAGFPGKLGVGGAQVWASYRNGAMAAIRDYCETDCANTYLLFLRFQLMRCALTQNSYRLHS
jgi:predicted PolB exonuclease-like 3'-5' exonuclease